MTKTKDADAMIRLVNEKPEDLTIEIVDCIDRGGNHYTHPFIGGFALSRALMDVLDDMGVGMYDGSCIPDEFFDNYILVECYSEKRGEDAFVTSDTWYTCRGIDEYVFCQIDW